MRPKTDVLTRNNVQIKGNLTANRTLLFAHGFGTDQTAWKYVWPAFANNYQIVLFDMVGANQDTVDSFSAERYSHLTAFANDLLDIVESLDLVNVILIGHSVGGMTSLLAAISEPTHFAGVVLVSASPRYLNDGDYEGGFSEADLDSLFTQMIGNYYAWASGFAPYIAQNANAPHIAGCFVKTLSGMRPDVGLAIARTIFHSDHRADLGKISQPTLVLQPEHDLAVPSAVGRYIAKTIPEAKLVVLPTEGHLPHLSNPTDVVGAIRTFVDQLPAYGLESV